MTFNRLVRDLEYQEVPEQLDKNQFICQNIAPVGNSLFKVRLPKYVTEKLLYVQLPHKWKKKILFGRGDLCLATFPNDFASMPEEETIGNIQMLITGKNFKQLVSQGKLDEFGFKYKQSLAIEEVSENEECVEIDGDTDSDVADQRESSPSYY